MAAETRAIIGGQEIGLLFGLPAIEYIQGKIQGLEPSAQMTFNVMQMVEIIYGGYLNWCKAENLEPSVRYRQFYDFVEGSAMNQDMTEVVRIIKLFSGSKEVKEEPEKEGEKKSLKKSIGMKSKHSASGKTGTTTGSPGGNISSLGGDTTRIGLNSSSMHDSLPIAL